MEVLDFMILTGLKSLVSNGAPGVTRTRDLLIRRQAANGFLSTYTNSVEQMRKISIMRAMGMDKGDCWI